MRKELFVMAAAGMFAMAAGCSTITQAETVSESVTQTTADDSSKTQAQRNVQETSGGGQTETLGAEETTGSRVLIAYFSRWGNTDYPEGIDASTSASIVADKNGRYGTTEYMANMIQNVTGGDLYLIQRLVGNLSYGSI